MELSRRTPYVATGSARYRQGDILRDLHVVEWAEIVNDELTITERRLPYAAVLSQECDLEHDFNNRNDFEKSKLSTDKYLPTILVCPAYPALQVKEGIHLGDLALKMQRLSGDQFKRIKQNNDSRYHYLLEDEENQLPELIVDFKHFFTISRNVIYRESVKKNYVCSLADLFREHLSSRFSHYISRIGLPELESA